MYEYHPQTIDHHAHIREGACVRMIFKHAIPTNAQGELMARALDPANVVLSRELLDHIANADDECSQIMAINRLREVPK